MLQMAMWHSLSAGSLMCGLLEDSSLFLWTPGSDKAPVVHSTPLSGMKIDAKDWKGPMSCLFQVSHVYKCRLLFVECLCGCCTCCTYVAL